MSVNLTLPPPISALIELDDAEHAPEYGGYLTNHAMHGIVALHMLGGTCCPIVLSQLPLCALNVEFLFLPLADRL